VGEDFIRKTERTYRRSLQRTVEQRFFTPPILANPETTGATYPCRLADGTGPLNTDAPLLLFRRPDRTIEILDTHNVIGTVEGDARHDLNDYLDTRRECSDVLRIWPRGSDGAHLDFTIEEKQ